MKKFSIISGVLATLVLTGLQAHATSTSFTNTLNGLDKEVLGTPYNGEFYDTSLLSGSTVFNNTKYTISSANVYITMLNAQGKSVQLTIDGITETLNDTTSPQILDYTLSATQYNYIQAQDGNVPYSVLADCELENAQLIVNANSSTASVPDGGSTVLLFGGVVTALGLLKRKMA